MQSLQVAARRMGYWKKGRSGKPTRSSLHYLCNREIWRLPTCILEYPVEWTNVCWTVLSAILPVWIRLPAKVANCTSNIQSALQHPPSNDKACNPGGGARALPRPMPRPRKGPWENQKWIELKGTKQEIVRPSNRKDYRLSWLRLLKSPLLDQFCSKKVRKRTQLASPLGKKVRKRIFPSTKSERFMGCFHRRLHHNITYQNEPWKIIHASTPKTSLRTSENRPIGRPEGRSEKLSSDSHVDLTYTSQVVG